MIMPPKRKRQSAEDGEQPDPKAAKTPRKTKPPVAKDADLARKVIDKFASTVADDLEIVNDGSKESLFQQLIAGEIFSTRISHTISLATLKVCWMVLSSELYRSDDCSARNVLFKDAKLTSPKKMKKTTWQERTEHLTKDGYAHYREKTASFPGEFCETLIKKYAEWGPE